MMMTARCRLMARVMLSLLAGMLAGSLGCGGGSSGADVAGNANLAGNWQMQLQQVSPPSTAIKTEAGFLTQSKGALSGAVLLGADTLCPGVGSVQGNVSGSKVTIAVSQAAQTVNLTGTASSDGSTMSGNYEIIASGCGDGSTAGTWTATQVKPFNGKYSATFTPGFSGGVAYNYAIDVTQAQNSGSSISNLTGSMTSSNAPCGAKFTLAGAIGGNSVVLNILTQDGVSVGQFRGPISTDAKTLSGTYDFLAIDQVCLGDAGLINLAQSTN